MNRWILWEILGLWKFLLIIIDINYVLLGIIEMIKSFSRVTSDFQSGLCNILVAWLLTRNLASLSFGSSYTHFPYNPISKKTEMQYHLISQWFSGPAMRSPEDEREESEIKSVPSTQISLFHVQGFFPYSLPWGPETTPSPLTFWAEELQQLHD